MPVVALLVVACVLLGGVSAIVWAVRRHRTPPELRGDWWTRFERDFHAYASRTPRSPRRPRRERG